MESIPHSLNSGLNDGSVHDAVIVSGQSNGVSGSSTYYDGTKNINVIKVNCDEFTPTPTICVNQHECGFCETTNSCMRGTPNGPLGDSCIASAFKYTLPSDWHPLQNPGTVNIRAVDKNNQPLIVKAPTPDLAKVFLNP
jgi:hypothetical protein